MLLSLAWYETNLIEVPSNTWWLDSGATINVSNKGFLIIQKPMIMERSIVMGNRLKAEVEAIGIFRLLLDTGFFLCELRYSAFKSWKHEKTSYGKMGAS